MLIPEVKKRLDDHHHSSDISSDFVEIEEEEGNEFLRSKSDDSKN